MTEDLEKKLKNAIIENKTPDNKGKLIQFPGTNTNISQSISGNGNVQVAGNLNFSTPKQPDIKILPTPETIGGDPLLKQRIQILFNKIGERREIRFGKNAYVVMYKKFKSDFGIKNAKWSIIWTWPKNCAPAIISYLEDKYNNTIQGRIEKAAGKKEYIHKRPYLYKLERELLDHLGMDIKSPEYLRFMKLHFGVTSHTKLSHLDHWQLVCYLENYVKEKIGEK
jgi:hypothetical protein